MQRELIAADIMQRDVVTTSPTASLREAMTLMLENSVSGLPVVDHKDRCVGVISATDVLRLEQERLEEAGGEAEELGSYFDDDTQRWHTLRMTRALDDVPDMSVGEVMSRDLVSVRLDSPLSMVAALMVDRGIHRVLVLDEKRFLHGIISASDFVKLHARSESTTR